MKPVNPKIRTSKKELQDLGIAWIIISIAFGIVLRPANTTVVSLPALRSIAIAALTVGIGFLIHEFAHKIIAQKYRCWAEFRASMQMLFFALIMSIAFGFVFAAPGAVMIQGNVTRRQNGIISLSGPATNLGLAILFFVGGLFVTGTGFLADVMSMGLYVNAFLGLFNLIPISVFDGKKILNWNKTIYGVLVAVGVGVFVLSLA